MKKYLLISLMLIPLLISACGIRTSNITEIEIVNPQNDEKNIISKDSNTAKLIVSALNKKENTTEDISSLLSYKIYLKNNTESIEYIFSFDFNDKKVYISKDNTTYQVKEKTAKEIFEDDNFSYVYINNTINKLYIHHNGNKINPSIKYDWTYKKLNGQINKKSGALSVSDEKLLINSNDKIDVKYDIIPDNQISRVYYKGDVIHTGKSLEDVIKSIRNDGEYFIESQYKWNQKKGNECYGEQTISFMAKIDETADFTVVSKENYPGNIMIVSVENLNSDETVKIKTNAVKTETEIYPYGEKYIAIMPIDLNAKIGEYDITAVFNEGMASEYKINKKVKINSKTFKTQYLTVSEELNSNNNDDKAIKEFIQYVKPARTESVPKKLWEGEFIMPVDGRLTTDFAEIRYVNNALSSTRHSGIDLAAPTGTEVKAPNNGKVTLAMNGLLSSGNTLVIDHGMGLFTSYYHLDTILVKTGDVVKKGDTIGTVGTSGFSTGPHLHYAVSIYNTYVNTYQPLNGIFE